jgi:hypothetical protein
MSPNNRGQLRYGGMKEFSNDAVRKLLRRKKLQQKITLDIGEREAANDDLS